MFSFEMRGCLSVFLILFLLLFLALKLWFVFAIILIIYIAKNFITSVNFNINVKKKEQEMNYEPKKGEVYKVCPFCGQSVKRSASKCPNCGGIIE